MIPQGSPKIEFVAKTDVGKVRKINEDSWFADSARNVFVVADGMGGHERGEWASGMTTRAMERIDPDLKFDTLVEQMADAVHEANRVIFNEAQDKHISMGTTFVGLCLCGGQFGILWAGDSRAYIFRGKHS